MSSPITVVVADDEPHVRLLLRIRLEMVADFQLVAEAVDGVDVLEQCHRLRPDVVVMDVMMPRMTGLEATRRLRRELPEIAVVAYTAAAGEEVRREMGRLGVQVILKTADLEYLTEAIREAAGERRKGAEDLR